jgi:hypothetical protein
VLRRSPIPRNLKILMTLMTLMTLKILSLLWVQVVEDLGVEADLAGSVLVEAGLAA